MYPNSNGNFSKILRKPKPEPNLTIELGGTGGLHFCRVGRYEGDPAHRTGSGLRAKQQCETVRSDGGGLAVSEPPRISPLEERGSAQAW